MERRSRNILILTLIGCIVGAVSISAFLLIAPDKASVGLSLQEQVARHVSNDFSVVESLSYQLIANKEMNEILWQYGENPDQYGSALFDMRFSGLIESQAPVRSLLSEAVFFDFDDVKRTPLMMTENLARTDYALIASATREPAVSADGACVWLDVPLLIWGRPHIVSARLIKRVATGEPIGVFVALLDSRDVASVAETVGPSISVDAGDMRSFVVSRTGVILAAGDAGLVGSPVSAAIGESRALSEAIGSGRDSGRLGIGSTSTMASVVYTREPRFGFFLLTVLPLRHAALRAVVEFCSFASAAMLAAVAIVSARARRASAPVSGSMAGAGRPGVAYSLPPGVPGLTGREREILERLVRGMSNKEIAFDLGLKEQTVKNCMGRLYGKIGVHDRVSALLAVRTRSEPAAE